MTLRPLPTTTRRPVVFECGHRSWLYAIEYGDGNAWCATCDRILDCEDDDAPEDLDDRPDVNEWDYGWRAALSGNEDDVISLPTGDDPA